MLVVKGMVASVPECTCTKCGVHAYCAIRVDIWRLVEGNVAGIVDLPFEWRLFKGRVAVDDRIRDVALPFCGWCIAAGATKGMPPVILWDWEKPERPPLELRREGYERSAAPALRAEVLASPAPRKSSWRSLFGFS